MKRIYNLDYLRGLAAFGIMIYHYSSWTFGTFDSGTFLGKLGIYGVSIFYILSGLTLFHVYFERMSMSKDAIISFFKKRVFRIFPLLWLVTVIGIIYSRKIPDLFDLLLNLTGVFGFVKWDTYFSVGAWSIGNELVFYVFFPIFIFLTKSSRILMIGFSFLIFCFYIYFAFFLLNTHSSLNEQWTNYVNPLNQVFLFLGGFLIGLFLQNIRLKNWVLSVMLLTSLSIVVFYPVYGDAINLVTGFNRLVFTFCCLAICASLYKFSIQLPVFIHRPSAVLGEISYSVYLLHPLVFGAVGALFTLINVNAYTGEGSVFFKLMVSVLITLILSYFVYEYYEKYFMKFGRKKIPEHHAADKK